MDHPPGQHHDDLANSVAGLASMLVNSQGSYNSNYRLWLGTDGETPDDAQEQARRWRVARLMQQIAEFG